MKIIEYGLSGSVKDNLHYDFSITHFSDDEKKELYDWFIKGNFNGLIYEIERKCVVRKSKYNEIGFFFDEPIIHIIFYENKEALLFRMNWADKMDYELYEKSSSIT